jgi:hypothetical protein
MDLFIAPTIGFELLYAFVIVRLDRRDLVWINVTTNPTLSREFAYNALHQRHYLEALTHADGIHWTAEGHALIANQLLQPVMDALGAPAR